MNLREILKSKWTFPILSIIWILGIVGAIYFSWMGSYVSPESVGVSSHP